MVYRHAALQELCSLEQAVISNMTDTAKLKREQQTERKKERKINRDTEVKGTASSIYLLFFCFLWLSDAEKG